MRLPAFDAGNVVPQCAGIDAGEGRLPLLAIREVDRCLLIEVGEPVSAHVKYRGEQLTLWRNPRCRGEHEVVGSWHRDWTRQLSEVPTVAMGEIASKTVEPETIPVVACRP